eukprot:344418-Chlamydomonas_euryale.AAC.1
MGPSSAMDSGTSHNRLEYTGVSTSEPPGNTNRPLTPGRPSPPCMLQPPPPPLPFPPPLPRPPLPSPYPAALPPRPPRRMDMPAARSISGAAAPRASSAADSVDRSAANDGGGGPSMETAHGTATFPALPAHDGSEHARR